MNKHLILTTVAIMFNTIGFGQAPAWLWAKSGSGVDEDQCWDIANDSYGNIYVTGYFDSPTIEFGNITLTNAGILDVFIAKFDSSGNVLWAQSAGGNFIDVGNGLYVDPNGNCYVTGSYADSITFGSFTIVNPNFLGRDAFTVKLDPNGNALWAKGGGGTGDAAGFEITGDAAGNSYVVGSFNGPNVTFETTTLTGGGSNDILLLKYDATGNLNWALNFGGNDYDTGLGIAADASNNIYITGNFRSPTIDFFPFTLTRTGLTDVLVVCFDPFGSVLWANSSNGNDHDFGRDISFDALGNSYVAGLFRSTSIYFGSFNLVNSGDADLFIVKYSPVGNVLWAQQATGLYSEEATAISTDASGNSYITGSFYSPTISFGSHTLTNQYSVNFSEIFVAKYSPSGSVLWAKSADGSRTDKAEGITLDNNDNCYITGIFLSPTVVFDNDTITQTGNGDVMIAKLSSTLTGTPEIQFSDKIKIYPNPAAGPITIDLENTDIIDPLNIQLLDLTGRIVLHRSYDSGQTITIDTEDLMPGVYEVRINRDEATVWQSKVAVVH